MVSKTDFNEFKQLMYIEIQQTLNSCVARLEAIAQKPGEQAIQQLVPNRDTDQPKNLFRSMKLEAPNFTGKDPNGWVYKIQEFFDFHGTEDVDRLKIMSLHLEDDALEWYRWMKANNLFANWTDFLEKIKKRFGPSQFEDFQSRLFKLVQTSTLDDYQSQFEKLLNKVTGVFESQLLSCFIGGLKSYLGREVRLARPDTLLEAIDLAKEFEARADETRSDRINTRHSWRTNSNTTNAQIGIGAGSYPKPTMETNRTNSTRTTTILNSEKKPMPFKRLNWKEQQERRAKGLCFNCDEKYSMTHDCKGRFLMLIVGDDDDVGIEIEDIGDPYRLEEVAHGLVLSSDVSSLNSLAGQNNPRSLRVWGRINGKEVLVLIDSGSMHNFVQPTVIEKLKIPTQQIPPFHVYIGNGDTVTCSRWCPKTALVLQGVAFEADLHILPIEGPDIVLGVQWL